MGEVYESANARVHDERRAGTYLKLPPLIVPDYLVEQYTLEQIDEAVKNCGWPVESWTTPKWALTGRRPRVVRPQ
jgi:hypothetical protein